MNSIDIPIPRQAFRRLLFAAWAMVLIVSIAHRAPAQTFNSGSTGADGAFAPTTNQTIQVPPSGVFNFTTINIPANVTITFTRNAGNTRVVMLATGNVTIAGTIDVSGKSGNSSEFTTNTAAGQGGPGGFDGGGGGFRIAGLYLGTPGDGPGGGGVSSGCPSNQAQFPFVGGAGGGFAEDAANGSAACGGIVNSQGGHAYGSPTLIPLIGGSGGSGGSGDTSSRGGGGGGGGGAILLASSTSITFGGVNGQGTIKSRGGDGTTGSGGGGGGSGGAIRLIANTITGAASFDVTGGAAAGGFSSSAGAPGRVRIETSSSTGFNPTIAPINKPGIISFALPSSVNPGNPPQLIITSVAGQNAPATPTNSIHGSPDLVVPNAQPNPVTVGLAATNIPVGTAIEVRVTPQVGSPTSVQSTALAGSIASSTATASINLPVGMNLITATVTVALSASARPLFIDGQQIGRIEVAAVYGRSGSEVTYISTSGRRITNK